MNVRMSRSPDEVEAMQRPDWRWQMSNRITSLERLQDLLPGFTPTAEQIAVSKRYPFAVTPYYASLIERADVSDPIYQMAVPQAAEGIDAPELIRDPLGEHQHSPVPGLLHRYPDRAVLLLNGLCPVYCRHCTRKRFVGIEKGAASDEKIALWADYLRKHPEIKDVILSGGDPLTMSNRRLERVLEAVRSVESVEIIRIGTRIPVLMPMRITPELCELLDRYAPVWVVTHFNHPREVTPLAAEACERLVRAGVPVNNQSVLLRGVNDHPDIMESLCRALMRNRIRPYYLHQSDIIQGIEHLRTRTSRGVEIMEALRGRLGGLAIPLYVLDLPEGGGKVPILPQYIVSQSPHKTVLRNFEGRLVSYPEPAQLDSPLDTLQRVQRGGIADQLSGVRPKALIPQGYKKPHERGEDD